MSHPACLSSAAIVLIVVCSMVLLQYAGWSAVYSGNFGLASRAQLVAEADHKGRHFLWIFESSGAGAILMATGLLSRRNISLPRLLGSFLGAILLVMMLVGFVSYAAVIIGQHLK
jgi:hypothetical protein